MASSKQKVSSAIERRAISLSGRLGSPYDGFRDYIIDHCNGHIQQQWSHISATPKCELLNGTDNTTNNLLQWMGVENELRFSLLLQLTKRGGIARVLTYPHCIDTYTRFLYYSRATGKVELSEKETQAQTIVNTWHIHTTATHIITSITHGIDVLLVLQLSPEAGDIKEIDRILGIICIALKEESRISTLGSIVNNLQERIVRTTVYSNIPSLTISTEISYIFRQIDAFEMSDYADYPLVYTLQLITTIYPSDKKADTKLPNFILLRRAERFRPLSSSLMNGIEQYILQYKNPIEYLDAFLNSNAPQSLRGHLDHQLKDAHKQWSEIKQKFMIEIRRLAKLVVDARSGEPTAVQNINQEPPSDSETRELNDDIENLKQHANDLVANGRLINDSRKVQSEYRNATQLKIILKDDIKQTESMTIIKNPHHQILCPNDDLKKTNPSKLSHLPREIVKKCEDNSQLQLHNTDFSDSSCLLPDTEAHPTKRDSNSTDASQLSSVTPPPSIDGKINILLLGESGVGKSTFINAFANYFKFSLLKQTQSDEPVVLIPASFTMTVGDNFEERTVKFGDIDGSNNEHFNTVGQSVTQHCKSYVFDMKDNEKKLRIIDTPGFGDTRGLEQDDQNMEHILQYISHLTHINAICFLLKPNSSRLNIFFRTCLTQLLSFLAPAARENVIFCFINARSTFSIPGDTISLLTTTFQPLSMTHILLKKENTFFFNSQWFRYLIALQNSISFPKDDQDKYEMIWSIFVRESNRFIGYVNRELRMHHLKNGWQSIKHAQFEISQMIRPILEAMRNILRNIILDEENQRNEFIQLQSKPVHHTATHCLSCKEKPELVGKFWIIPTVQHEIQDDCRLCKCPVNQHVRLNYMLKYRYLYNASSQHQNTTKDVLETLCGASSRFAHFLKSTDHSTNDDPFLMGLEQMIDEEKQICDTQISSDFNLYLFKKLTQLRELYESCKQKIIESRSHRESIDLPATYRLISDIDKDSMVQEQMAAVKQSQQLMLKNYEHEVETI